MKYRFEGKEKRLSLGVFPDVSLKDAHRAIAASDAIHDLMPNIPVESALR